MTDFTSRDITPTLTEALKAMPVVVLTGMRQSGKSTLLKQGKAFKNRRYIDLDSFVTMEEARRNPEQLLSGDEPITIDEIQKVPELLTVIKRKVDQKRIPGQFLLSGSTNLLLLKGISESLAGRAVYFKLDPMSRREIGGENHDTPFLLHFFQTTKLPKNISENPIQTKEVLLGGMPSVCLKETTNPSLWFLGYEQTYLERDVRALSQIGDLVPFRTLLRLSALRTAQILNHSELGRDSKLNSTRVTRYLSLMETGFLISRIPPFLTNKASRLIKSPKLYFADSGIASFLTLEKNTELKNSHPLFGALFETYVFQNISAIIDAKWPSARLFFWHVQGRYEVDFVIESAMETIAIEIKAASRWDDRDLSGLKMFLEKTPNCKAAILAYNGTEAISLGNKLWAIPISQLIS